MEGSTAGFADRLFGLPNQIAIMDHLAEWINASTFWMDDDDLLRPNCTTPNSNGCVSLRNANLRRAFSINLGKCP